MSLSDLRPILQSEVKDKWKFVGDFYRRDWIFGTWLEKFIVVFLFFYFLITFTIKLISFL